MLYPCRLRIVVYNRLSVFKMPSKALFNRPGVAWAVPQTASSFNFQVTDDS